MNKAIVAGHVSSYGPKISWTESGKAQTSFTLVLDKAGYQTFVPVLCVGPRAPDVAETINPGDLLIIEGSLSWRAGRTKEAGRLQIVCFDVERLTTLPSDETSPVDAVGGISTGEIVAPGPTGEVAPTKKRVGYAET